MQSKLPQAALSELLTEFDAVLLKVAHSLRSPLSVLSGIIEDLESGSSLTTDDISDAKLSLQRILQELSNLRLAPLPDTKPILASDQGSIAEKISDWTGLKCHAKGNFSLRGPTDIRVLIAMTSLLSYSDHKSATDSERNSELEIEEKNGMLRVSLTSTSREHSACAQKADEVTPPARTSPTLVALQTLLRGAYSSALQAQMPSTEESCLLFELPFSQLEATLPLDPAKNTALPTPTTPK